MVPEERGVGRAQVDGGAEPVGDDDDHVWTGVDGDVAVGRVHGQSSLTSILNAARRAFALSPCLLAGSFCGLQSRHPARRDFGRRRLWLAMADSSRSRGTGCRWRVVHGHAVLCGYHVSSVGWVELPWELP